MWMRLLRRLADAGWLTGGMQRMMEVMVMVMAMAMAMGIMCNGDIVALSIVECRGMSWYLMGCQELTLKWS